MSNVIKNIVNRKTNHIAGTFAISASAAFLNGAGLGKGEDKNKSTVKSFWKNKRIPYVSSQAWRRWLRNTIHSETGWIQSEIEAVGWNNDGNTSKIAGQLDPIKYQEDDIFGYMFASGKETKVDKEKSKKKTARDRLPKEQLIRTSPFKSSLLSGVPSLTRVSEDEGYVHLKDDTPLPYTTQFYSGELTALFGLEIYRLGIFERKGKTNQELDPELFDKYNDKLEKIDHPIYSDGFVIKRNNLIEYQNELAGEVVKSLAKLNGGAKLAQFAADTAPKLLIIVGMNSPHILFDNILISQDGEPAIHINALKEIISDYKDKITTDLYIGIRTGYLANEADLRDLTSIDGVNVVINTPSKVAEEFSKVLN